MTKKVSDTEGCSEGFFENMLKLLLLKFVDKSVKKLKKVTFAPDLAKFVKHCS